MKLSARLQALYNELIPGMPVVDLCCDHGHLGLYAYESEQFPEIVFVDQAALAMRILAENFQKYVKDEENLTHVTFITADVGKLQISLKGNVVAAGVGGINLMIMLKSLHESGRLECDVLIVSPHRNNELYEHAELFGLKHSHTHKITETGRERSIFVFKRA
jgi:tRNA A22 N-methylase